jgi:hypothetical protein
MTRRSRAERQARRPRAPDSVGRSQAVGTPRPEAGWDRTKPLPPLDPDVGVEILEHPDAAIAPEAYEPVRQVLSAASAPPRPDEIAGDVVAAALFVAAREATLSECDPVVPDDPTPPRGKSGDGPGHQKPPKTKKSTGDDTTP